MSTQQTIDLSVISPCYNEQESLAAFLDAITDALDASGLTYELVLINDGSLDRTGELLHAFASSGRAANVTVVDFSRNFGKESGILAGLQHARGQALAIIDSDLQQQPSVMLDMYRQLVEHPEYDCVAAYQEQRREGLAQRLFKEAFYRTFNAVTDTQITADASDFRVFRRNVADALLAVPEYHRFSKGLFAWVGFNTLPWPYTPDERAGGESKWSLRKLFRYAFGGIISFSTLPLSIATWVGSISSLAAVIYFFVVLYDTNIAKNTPDGYPTIVCLILLLGGLTLLTLGIIGTYIARIYIEDKHRPVYIARSVTTVTNGKAVTTGVQTSNGATVPR